MLFMVSLALAGEVRCNDGVTVGVPDLCYVHGGKANPELIEIGEQTARVADETARVADETARSRAAMETVGRQTARAADETARAADEMQRVADEAALTREVLESLGDAITEEMKATREWGLASQQATLEVQSGLLSARDFMLRTREIYLENYQPDLWAMVLRLRAARAEAARRRAYIVALVGESNVDMYESFARSPGACVLEVADGAWVKLGSATSIVKLRRVGGRSIGTDESDVQAYSEVRGSDPRRERCVPE